MRSFWAAVLVAVGVLGFLFGGSALSDSRSALHELEALIAFVIGVAGVGLGAVVSGLEAIRRELTLSRPRALPSAPGAHAIPPYAPPPAPPGA